MDEGDDWVGKILVGTCTLDGHIYTLRYISQPVTDDGIMAGRYTVSDGPRAKEVAEILNSTNMVVEQK